MTSASVTDVLKLCSTPIIVSTVGDGRIVDANNAACMLFDASLQRLRDVRIQALLRKITPGGPESEFRLDASMEFTVKLGNGDFREFQMFSEQLHSSKAKNLQVHFIHDVTQRNRTEQARRMAEHEFCNLAQHSMTGIYIVQDELFSYVNPRMAEILGYENVDKLIGRNPLTLIVEADRLRVGTAMRALIEAGTGSLPDEFGVCRRDGSYIRIGTQYTVTSMYGHTVLAGMLQDISEKHRVAEEITQHIAQLKRNFENTIGVITALIEMRDPYTAGHEHRVGAIAVNIAAELGMDAHAQEGIKIAGYLHDIGKVAIPSEILTKPKRLTTAEYLVIKDHPESGYSILKNMEFAWPVAEIVLQHHERADGSGYPKGLKNKDILPEARIIAVADVVESMASYRPYRPGLGIDAALREIETGNGTIYDSQVVQACLQLFRHKGYELPT